MFSKNKLYPVSSFWKRLLTFLLALLIVAPILLSPIIAYAEDSSSSSSSSGDELVTDSVAPPTVKQTDWLSVSLEKIETAKTQYGGRPERVVAAYLELLSTVYQKGFDPVTGASLDNEFSRFWNESVTESTATESAPTLKTMLLKEFGDGGENKGEFFESTTSPIFTLYDEEIGKNYNHEKAFGSFKWVTKMGTWDDLQAYADVEAWEAEEEAWYAIFTDADAASIVTAIADSVVQRSLKKFLETMDSSLTVDARCMRTYMWNMIKALNRYDMIYVRILANEVVPCPSRFISSDFEVGTIKAASIPDNELAKKIFGITGSVKDLPKDKQDAFDALNFSIHESKEYCTSKCFDAVGFFVEGSDTLSYALKLGIQLASGSDKGTYQSVIDYVDEANTSLELASAALRLTSEELVLTKHGEFVLPAFMRKTFVEGWVDLFKQIGQGIKSLFGFEPANVFAYPSGVVTYYRWITVVAPAATEELTDGADKEADRRIGVGPELIYNFIQRSDEDVRYTIKDNVLTGIACSSLFRPLQTNVNDFDYKSITESPNFLMFHNKYGSLRKALLISDTSDSVAQYYRTGKINNLRIATLEDMITDVGTDKLLMVQDTYYNLDATEYTMTAEDIIANADYNFTTLTEMAAGVANAATDAIGKVKDSLDEKAQEKKDKQEEKDAEEAAKKKEKTDKAEKAQKEKEEKEKKKEEKESSSKTEEETASDAAVSSMSPKDAASSRAAEDMGDPTSDPNTAKDSTDAEDSVVQKKTGLGEKDASPLAGKFTTHYNEWRKKHFSFEEDVQRYSETVAKSKTFRNFINDQVTDDDIAMAGVTPFSGLSVILSIMGHKELADVMNNPRYATSPIYMASSRNIDDIDDTVYYNYLMLQNISKNAPIRYNSALDQRSPLFIDIYGNIVTESGIVVIPISANASMSNCTYTEDQRSSSNKVNWLTVANLLFYGDSAYISKDKDGNPSIAGHPVDLTRTSLADVSQYLPFASQEGDTSVFVYDAELNRYYINPVIVPVTSGSFTSNINIATLNSGDPEILKALYRVNRAINDRSITETISLNFPKWFASVCYQVVKGAKMSDIDYEKEGIEAPKKFSNGTLAQAAKYEDFHENLVMPNGNSLLTIPNLMYTNGFEYVIFLTFRLMMIVTVVALIVQIYQQAVKSRLNLVTFLKVLGNMLLVISIVFLVPAVFDITYYQTNKLLLQGEALTVSALNAEKRNSGVELGISRAARVDSVSDVYVTIDTIEVNWFDYLRDLLADPKILNMQDLYMKYMNTIPVASDSFELKGNKVYLDVAELFDSSIILTDFNSHRMRQVVDPSPDASFYLPYYAIIDYMTYNINQFNSTVDSYNYDKFFYGDGRLRSVGLIKSYLLADAFLITAKDISDPFFKIPENVNELTLEMAGYDKCGVNQFYGNIAGDARTIFTSTEGFKSSQWYLDNVKAADLRKIADRLDEEAIKFVLENEELIGRVSDETFIKMYALHMSLKFNNEFKCGGPRYLEIFNFNNEDISRLTTVPTDIVMQSSPYNYPKFVLENIGLPGVYVAAVLDFIILAGSFIKPAATIFIFIAMLLSIFVYKCLLHKNTDNLKGLAILTILLCLGNLAYAVMVKFCIMLPNAGIPPLICLLLQIVFQYMYIQFYLYLAITVLRNWKDLGAGTFANIARMKTVNMKEVTVNDWKFKNAPTIEQSDEANKNRVSDEVGWNLYNEMKRRDKVTHVDDEDDTL